MSNTLYACPLCSGSDLREQCRAKDPHYGIPGLHRVVRCADCSLTFLNPMYSDEELRSLYPKDYYAYQNSPPAPRWKAALKKLLGYWHGTKEPPFSKPGRFLDIGCGNGQFVAFMRAKGWDACGVEMNQIAADAGRTKGLKIFCGSIEDAGFLSDSFDYVRASHSLEHMAHPHRAVAEIERILKPEGQLLVAVPNTRSLPARIFGRYWWHLCAPVHTFGYCPVTIEELLHQHGLRIVRLQYNSDYVGLIGSLQIWINRNNGKSSSDGLAFNNRFLRVISGWIQHGFDAAACGDMIEVTAIKPLAR